MTMGITNEQWEILQPYFEKAQKSSIRYSLLSALHPPEDCAPRLKAEMFVQYRAAARDAQTDSDALERKIMEMGL
jgi:hypothetical protein